MPRCRCGTQFTCTQCGAPVHDRGALFPADGSPPRGAWAHAPGTRPADGHRAAPDTVPPGRVEAEDVP